MPRQVDKNWYYLSPQWMIVVRVPFKGLYAYGAGRKIEKGNTTKGVIVPHGNAKLSIQPPLL